MYFLIIKSCAVSDDARPNTQHKRNATRMDALILEHKLIRRICIHINVRAYMYMPIPSSCICLQLVSFLLEFKDSASDFCCFLRCTNPPSVCILTDWLTDWLTDKWLRCYDFWHVCDLPMMNAYISELEKAVPGTCIDTFNFGPIIFIVLCCGLLNRWKACKHEDFDNFSFVLVGSWGNIHPPFWIFECIR